MRSCTFAQKGVRSLLFSFFAVLFTTAAVAVPNAPTNLRCAVTGTNSFTLIWDDNSTDESSFDLLFTNNGGGSSSFGLGASPGTGTISVNLSGLTGTATFQIRANGTGSSLSNVVSVSFASFGAPSDALTSVQADGSLLVMWTDNAYSEAGYLVEIATAPGGPYAAYGSTSANFTGIFSGTLQPATTYYFRIRGFQGTAASPTAVTSYSPVVSATTPASLNAPTSLMVTSIAPEESSVNFSFTDNTALNNGYEYEFKVNGVGSFVYLAESGDASSINAPNLLQPGTTYDFRCRAFYDNGSTRVYSGYSNTATVTTKDGFTSAPYITFGANNAYTYQATTTSASPRTSWNAATGLPAGMIFNTTTGAITGAPTEFGLFNATLSATFADGWTATLPLAVRVVRLPGAPTVVSALPTARTFNPGDGAATISLTGAFADPDTESAVRLVTTKGNVDVLLYETQTPATFANFMGYVGRGDYDNSAFHRISDLASSGVAVLQGGQIKPSVSGPTAFTSITTQSTIANEPGLSNLRYTIAMAKQGGNPNSATKEFYFNLTDLNAVLDPPSQNGGFTVFGRVSDATKANLDAMASAPVGGPYTTVVNGVSTNTGFKWPMNVATAGEVPATMDNTKIMTIVSATPISEMLTLSASSADEDVATAAVVGSDLVITPVGQGQVDVTVTATDLDGLETTQTVTVTVNAPPVFTNGPPPSPALVGSGYSFAYTASGFPAPTFSHTGTLPPGLTLSSAGVLSGTPTTAGTYSGIVITASNGIGTAPTQSISITVNQVPAITSGAAPAGILGVAYSHSFTATGSPAPTFSTSDPLPTGLTLSPAGVLSGTPSATGTFSGTVTATNVAGTSDQAFNIVINEVPAFTNGPPPNAGTVGTAYNFSFTASGTPAPTFAVTAGALPAGLSLSTAGVISGTPTTAGGPFTGTVTASNGIGTPATQGFSITIAKGTAVITLGGLSQTYDGTPKSVTAGSTPGGLTIDVTYGGSATPPTAHGSYAVSAVVNDDNWQGSASDTLVISGQSVASWRAQFFTAQEILDGLADDDADPDGDGQKNLAEYALGTHPRVRTAAPAPVVDANGLTLTFTRPKDLPDVDYAAESTDSLSGWNPVTLEVIGDGPVQTVRARDTLGSGNPARRMMRLIFSPTP